jgi:hypothetical protein
MPTIEPFFSGRGRITLPAVAGEVVLMVVSPVCFRLPDLRADVVTSSLMANSVSQLTLE